MKPLRLLLVTARYAPFMGGIETHTREVGRRLAASGLDVTVLTADPGGRLPKFETRDGLSIRRVHAWPAERDYYFAPGVRGIIRDGQWDLIHCQGCHTFVPPLAMAAARQARVPYVVTFHTGGHSSRLRNAVRGIQWEALRPLLVRATQWVGVSQYELDYFQARLHLPKDRCHLIPNGSDLPELSAPVTPEPGLILSVGRLERFKGHQRMIAAMPRVRAQIPHARLLVLGHGPYEAELRRLTHELGAEPYVEIRSIPPAERAQMAQTLARAALVVLLSEAESHPVAVMEALLLGRPVLVADTSGLSELARRQLVRAIPLAATSEAVAAAVVSELTHPQPRAQTHLPTWDDCAAGVLGVYESVLAEKALCAS